MLISKQISISIFVIATMIVIIGVFAWFITTNDMGRMHSSIKTVNHNLQLMNDLEESIQNVNEGVFDQNKKFGLKEEIERFSGLVEQMDLPKENLKLEQILEIENEYLLLLQSNRDFKEGEKLAALQLIAAKQFNYLEHLRTIEKEHFTTDVTMIADRIGLARIGSVSLSFVFFSIVIYVGYFLKNRLDNSVLELKEAAKAIEQGNYTQKKSFKGDTELGILGESLNQLASRAKQAETIEKQNQQLGDLNRELKLKNDSLDSFVYRVSHDLKAPVINIQSLLAVINKQVINIDDEILKKTTFFMDKTTKKLEQTIYDLLEVSRIERNLDGKKERLIFKEIMDEVLIENVSSIERDHVKVVCDFEQIPEVYFSRIYMKSVISNLLTNAIKYHSKDRPPMIEVKSYLSEGYVCLSIRDNGVGIDLEKHKEKLFGMFNRFHSHVEGSGVGLYIVKKLVDENGGRLEIESVVNQGTRMKAFFPQEKLKVAPVIESAFG